MDTNLIDVDLQPIYVKITIKGKVFQIVFPEEVAVDRSVAQRSQTTGHLVLKLPKSNFKVGKFKEKKVETTEEKKKTTQNVYLEIEEKEKWDISKIVENELSKKFIDNVEVPPLEYA